MATYSPKAHNIPPLEPSWAVHLGAQFSMPYMVQLKKFLTQELKQGRTLYPHGKDIFNAFNYTPLAQLKVTIIGQDPYHRPGQAHGLCFSVPPKIPAPPSLVNIFREQQSDLGLTIPGHGSLISWAKQGVLLLNSVLTVAEGRAASHCQQGWERFTDKVVEVIDQHTQNTVFLLWGSAAQLKGKGINPLRHHILKAPHPSPLSAYRGFLGCRHFSKTNHILHSTGRQPINWQLPPSGE